MGLIHHEPRAIFLGDGAKLGQRGGIAQHAVEPFGDHQRALGLFPQTPQALAQVLGVIVAEGKEIGPADAAAVIDAGMAMTVQYDLVAGAQDAHQKTQIGLIAGGKHHGRRHAVELGKGSL